MPVLQKKYYSKILHCKREYNIIRKWKKYLNIIKDKRENEKKTITNKIKEIKK